MVMGVGRVTMTPEAVQEAKALLAAEPLDGVRNTVLRIEVGSCGLRRPVAAPAPRPEPGDEVLEVEGVPVAIAATLAGNFHITVGRGRFGAWLNVEQRP
jgi:Fe-S cluster assembly iron-binding protein IscA